MNITVLLTTVLLYVCKFVSTSLVTWDSEKKMKKFHAAIGGRLSSRLCHMLIIIADEVSVPDEYPF